MGDKSNKDKWLAGQFDNAFKEHYHKVRYLATHFLKEQEQAENIAQDVFMGLWEKRYEVDFAKSVLPWLVTITRNKCLNIIKNYKVQQKYQERSYNVIMDLRADLAKSSSESMLLNKEAEVLLKEAMEKMTPSMKETFLLCRFKEKKYEEAAKIQNVSVKTIEYRIMCALRILRKEFRDFLVMILV